MTKILILANNDVGLYKFRKELIEELVKSYEVYISLPDGDLVSKLEALGCTFIDTPVSRRGTNPITDFKLFMRYRSIIKNIKPDIVLTYTIKPNVYGGLACGMANIPYVTNITGLGSAVENDGLLQKITLLLYKFSLKKSSCIFFQNEGNMDFFEKNKIVGRKQKLIPGSGVNLDEYTMMEYPEGNKINFLFIARVMKEKGIDQYLEAAKYFKDKYPNTVFHIVGHCEQEYEYILKRLQEKGIIKYHGMQKDVRKFYGISSCTIHPTYYPEGMSNVLLESAACGRPIITTNRSGCREIVDDGVNGYVVKQNDSNDLIEKIEQFLYMPFDKRKELGLAGRVKIEKQFDRQIVVDAYMEQIQSEIG